MTHPTISDLLDMTSDIVTAYVSHNDIKPSALPAFIEQIFETVQNMSDPQHLKDKLPKPVPALPIEKSVTEDYIYSLEDGQPYKSLKRHLKAKYGMTPKDYRDKWGLPVDYPMVAPAYARARSELAKKSGLGRGASGGE